MSRIVPAPDALVGKRFDVAVAKMLGISRSKAADLVDSGQARVLGREVARSSTLQAGACRRGGACLGWLDRSNRARITA